MSSEKIQLMMIIEVMGNPKEYLTETLEQIMKNMEQEKGVKVISKKINEAVEVKEKPGLFTNFVEIDAEVDTLRELTLIAFKYMPAHMDIMYPEEIVVSNNFANEFFNEIMRKLHGYDNLARVFQYERAQMVELLKKAGIKILTPEEKKALDEKRALVKVEDKIEKEDVEKFEKKVEAKKEKIAKENKTKKKVSKK